MGQPRECECQRLQIECTWAAETVQTWLRFSVPKPHRFLSHTVRSRAPPRVAKPRVYIRAFPLAWLSLAQRSLAQLHLL